MYKGVTATLEDFKPEDYLGLKGFGEKIGERSQRNLLQLVEVLHGDNQENARKAALIIACMENLFLKPLLDGVDSRNPENLVWDMQTVVSAHLDNQSRIDARLDAMLRDTRPHTLPGFPGEAEEEPVPRRVCDEAYLMKRQLLAGEDEDTREANSAAFLEMTDEARDAEIERLQQTRAWISLIGQEDDERTSD